MRDPKPTANLAGAKPDSGPRDVRRCGSIAVALVAFLAVACGGPSVPAPKDAASEFALAVKRKDAAAVHAMLDQESRRAVNVQQVQLLLDRDQPELQQKFGALTAAGQPWKVRSTTTLAEGRMLSLEQEGADFCVATVPGLSGVALTPLGAVSALRAALEGRNYPALLRTVTSDLGQQLEQRLSSLVEALKDETVLDVQVDGNRALINTSNGHRVELEVEEGVWKVRDFD